MKIAILGATGHIAKNLIHYFSTEHELYFYSRTPGYKLYCNLINYKYDMIINCVGIGTYSNIKNYYNYFKVIEHFDNICIDYLKKNHKTLYINFSSGVVPEFNGEIKQDNYYAISKMYSEAKHRSLSHLNIIDIRLYSFFSRFIDLKDDYFLNQIIKHIKENKTLVTTPDEMVREYIHPKDLADFIISLDLKNYESKIELNQVCTVGSLESVAKREILDYFEQKHGLKYIIDQDIKIPCATGTKTEYYPDKIDNDPKYTSLETIAMEAQVLLT